MVQRVPEAASDVLDVAGDVVDVDDVEISKDLPAPEGPEGHKSSPTPLTTPEQLDGETWTIRKEAEVPEKSPDMAIKRWICWCLFWSGSLSIWPCQCTTNVQ